jgi:hypothetical protein
MSKEEIDKKTNTTAEPDSFDLKIDKILKIVTTIVVIGAVSWFLFNLFNGLMT